jgi:hypothetical protein
MYKKKVGGGGEQQQHEFLALPEQSYSKKMKS